MMNRLIFLIEASYRSTFQGHHTLQIAGMRKEAEGLDAAKLVTILFEQAGCLEIQRIKPRFGKAPPTMGRMSGARSQSPSRLP